MKRVLFLTHEPLAESMGGAAIRAWELAHVIANQQPVTVGTPNVSSMRSSHVKVECFRDGALRGMLADHDVVIVSWLMLQKHPVIGRLAKHLVVDAYDPFVLNDLFTDREEWGPGDKMRLHQYRLDLVLQHLIRGDYFICASERQRDYWLGALSLANRINPYTYTADPTFRKLIDVVPFGLPSSKPSPTRAAIRGTASGITAEDTVVLWAGGIWDSLDPLTAIRASAALRDESPNVKLYFMGTAHPNEAKVTPMTRRAISLAKELGVLNRQVFFREGWVPYPDRVNYLCDADIGISLHSEHIESRLAFRTRVLDFLWTGLPLVATGGDVLSDLISSAGAGVSVAQHDVTAVSQVLYALSRNKAELRAMKRRMLNLSSDFVWPRIAAPLMTYCQDPWRASDRGRRGVVRPHMSTGTVRLHRIIQIARSHGIRSAFGRTLEDLAGILETAPIRGHRTRRDP